MTPERDSTGKFSISVQRSITDAADKTREGISVINLTLMFIAAMLALIVIALGILINIASHIHQHTTVKVKAPIVHVAAPRVTIYPQNHVSVHPHMTMHLHVTVKKVKR